MKTRKESTHKEQNVAILGYEHQSEQYNCAWCERKFTPRKRFSQKYCCESCRVLAYRARKSETTGLFAGNPESKPDNFRKSDENQKPKEPSTPKNQETLEEIKKLFEIRDKELLSKVDKIQEQQNYLMWISALAPLLADPVRKSIINLFSKKPNPENFDQLIKILEPRIKDLPADLKINVLKAAQEFWDGQKNRNDLGKFAGMISLEELGKVL